MKLLYKIFPSLIARAWKKQKMIKAHIIDASVSKFKCEFGVIRVELAFTIEDLRAMQLSGIKHAALKDFVDDIDKMFKEHSNYRSAADLIKEMEVQNEHS